ncbi:MAG: S8 family serine peptidase, partial [Verrucomicrobiota bacterium]
MAAIVFSTLLLNWLRREPVAVRRVAPAAAVVPSPALANAVLRFAAADILRTVAEALNGPDASAVLQARLETYFSQPGALPNESVLTFKDAAAYQAFLARAAAAGLDVAGRVDGLLTARVRFAALDGLAGDLLANAGDYLSVAVNTVVVPPTAPAPEDRAGGSQVAVGNNLLRDLGITGDHSTWGQGITIAVLDSGVAPDATLGSRLRTLDLGLGAAPAEGDGHATAVASLAAGASPDAAGVAPGADILSIRVTGDDGTSDVFTLAQAIVAAADNGAQIINISMGAYSNSAYLSNA